MPKQLVTFFVSAVVSGILFATTGAAAATWWRTVDGSACTVTEPNVNGSSRYQACPFISDTIEGATSLSGNGASTIYADWVVGENHVENLYISACGRAFNNQGGSCGTSVYYASQTYGFYDRSLPLWKGTTSQWDYFFVTF